MNKGNKIMLKYLYLLIALTQVFIANAQTDNGKFLDFVKVFPWSGRSNGFIGQSAGSNYSYLSLGNENSSYGIWEMRGPVLTGSNYSIIFRHSSTTNPILDILNNGNIGVGTSTPTNLLHLKNNQASIFLDGTIMGSSANDRISFGLNGTSNFELLHTQYNGPAPGYFKLGPVSSASKSIYMPVYGLAAGKIVFSNSFSYAYGDLGSSYGGITQGLSGSYIFDNQVSSTSLLVSPSTNTLPYPSINSGYIFNVKGNSSMNGLLQIDNTSDADPNNSVAGITVASNTTNVSPAIPYSWIQTQESRPLALNPVPNANPNTINTSYVAIGFVPGSLNVPLNYKLAVKGKIICEELKVKYSGTWSDYVFQKDYKLSNLKEVEAYITEHKHLPNVPSAEEIKENGFESGEMDATLLRKIEELTLYVIDLNNKVDALNKSNELLQQKNEQLEKQIMNK